VISCASCFANDPVSAKEERRSRYPAKGTGPAVWGVYKLCDSSEAKFQSELNLAGWVLGLHETKRARRQTCRRRTKNRRVG